MSYLDTPGKSPNTPNRLSRFYCMDLERLAMIWSGWRGAQPTVLLYADHGERHHDWAIDVLAETEARAMTSQPVVAEVWHLLGRAGRGRDALLSLIEDGLLEIDAAARAPWTTTGLAPSVFDFTCAMTGTPAWPNVYWAVCNANGFHLMNDHSHWVFSDSEYGMHVWMR